MSAHKPFVRYELVLSRREDTDFVVSVNTPLGRKNTKLDRNVSEALTGFLDTLLELELGK